MRSDSARSGCDSARPSDISAHGRPSIWVDAAERRNVGRRKSMATDGRLNRAHCSETGRAFYSEPMLCMPHVASNAARMVAGTCCAARRSRACIFVSAWSLTGWTNTEQVHKRATFGMDPAFKGMPGMVLDRLVELLSRGCLPPPGGAFLRYAMGIDRTG